MRAVRRRRSVHGDAARGRGRGLGRRPGGRGEEKILEASTGRRRRGSRGPGAGEGERNRGGLISIISSLAAAAAAAADLCCVSRLASTSARCEWIKRGLTGRGLVIGLRSPRISGQIWASRKVVWPKCGLFIQLWPASQVAPSPLLSKLLPSSSLTPIAASRVAGGLCSPTVSAARRLPSQRSA